MIYLPYAVSNRKGDITFELSKSNYGDHRVRGVALAEGGSERASVEVNAARLDDLPVDLTIGVGEKTKIPLIGAAGRVQFFFQ